MKPKIITILFLLILSIFVASNLLFKSMKTPNPVTDITGKSSFVGQFALEIIDPTVPVMLLSQPGSGIVTSVQDWVFECNATDDGGLENITLYVWNSSGVYYNSTTAITGVANSSNGTLLGMPEGDYEWNCRVFDATNKSDWGNGNRTLGIDLTSPNVTLVGPSNETSTSTTPIPFQFNVTDAHNIQNCSLIIDNATAYNSSSITRDVTQEFSIGLSVGVYEWMLSCYDVAGHDGNSTLYTITITEAAQPPGPGGGGGGGGGGGVEEPEVVEAEEIEVIIKPDFVIEPKILMAKLEPGERKVYTITVKNRAAAEVEIIVDIQGIEDFASISENILNVMPGTEKTIEVEFNVPSDEPDMVTMGKIVLRASYLKQETHVVLDVKKKLPVELDVVIAEKYKELEPGQVIKAELIVTDNRVVKTPTVIKSSIRDFENKILMETDSRILDPKETHRINTKWNLPEDMKGGRYVVIGTLSYETDTLESYDVFEVLEVVKVVQEPMRIDVRQLIGLIILLLILLLLLVLYTSIKKQDEMLKNGLSKEKKGLKARNQRKKANK